MKSSAGMDRVSIWLPPECDGMSARGQWWERAGRNVQEVDDEFSQNWTAVHQTIASKMLKCLEKSKT